MLKFKIILLLMALQQSSEINEYSLGDDFRKYYSQKVLSLNDPLTSIEYGVAGGYNYLYIADDATYSFLNRVIKKVAFKVKENIIIELMIFIDTDDVNEFYFELTKKFGKPNIARISSTYLERYGYRHPAKSNIGLNVLHNNVPEPKVSDFQYLNGVSWFDFNNKLDKTKFETSMHVRNETTGSQDNKYLNTMIIRFKLYNFR